VEAFHPCETPFSSRNGTHIPTPLLGLPVIQIVDLFFGKLRQPIAECFGFSSAHGLDGMILYAAVRLFEFRRVLAHHELILPLRDRRHGEVVRLGDFDFVGRPSEKENGHRQPEGPEVSGPPAAANIAAACMGLPSESKESDFRTRMEMRYPRWA
jgi:hypothetical protein